MFGYVRPLLRTEEEERRFRGMYCGLCHTLGRRYGPAARGILNYDFTLLAILLAEGEGVRETRRCVVHPLHGRTVETDTESLKIAADESVILAYWQLRDGGLDNGPLRRLPYQGAAAAFRGAYEKASSLRGDFDEAVRRELDHLHELERERCASLDRPADAFATLLAYAARDVTDPARRRVLEEMLYHLGRWVYLIDAADDLKRDAAEGNYNPVALRYGLEGGIWTEDARRSFAVTLDHSVHRIAAAFELWDFGVWRPILEGTIYTGLFQVGRAVLDGTFHRSSRLGRGMGAGHREQDKNDPPPSA